MRFIKRKNLLEGEALLYVPELHWMFILKNAIGFMLLIPVMFIVRAGFIYSGDYVMIQIIKEFFTIVILALGAVSILILIRDACRYAATEYGITNKRLIMRKGFFKIFAAEIPLDRAEGICCVQGICGRIFNYGNIYISGIGGKARVFYMVCRPYAVRRKVIDIIEKSKLVTVVHGNLPQIKAVPKPVEADHMYGTFVKVMPEGRGGAS